MSWTKVTFSPKVTENAAPHNLRSLATQIYERENYPDGFIVFSSFDNDEEKDVAYPVYYFSPIAALYCDELLKAFSLSLSDCDAPPSDADLRLIIGSENVRGLL